MTYSSVFFAGGIQTRDIYPEAKNYFYKEKSNVIWEEFLTTKFGVWIDARSSPDNNLQDSGEIIEERNFVSN